MDLSAFHRFSRQVSRSMISCIFINPCCLYTIISRFQFPVKQKKEFLPNQKLFFEIYLFFLTPSGTNVLQS